jgi:hypothetical protein
MDFNKTGPIKETTIYRVLGSNTSHVINYLVRDSFTRTLLGMIFFTNSMVIVIPMVLSLFDLDTAKTICKTTSIALMLGYGTLLVILCSRLRRSSGIAIGNGLRTRFTSPVLRNMIIGTQCLLFASLISSTFIMKQQLGLIKLVDPSYYTQEAMSGSGSSQTKPMDILPLLNE